MKGNVTIARTSNDKMVIRIGDELSGVQFATLTMSLADFTLALTGRARVEGGLEVRNLHRVGKKLRVKRCSVEAPRMDTTKEYIEWLKLNHSGTGWWVIDDQLNSQGSIVDVGDRKRTVTLTFIKRKWVALTPKADEDTK